MSVGTAGRIGMRKTRFIVRPIPGGWGVFEFGCYNMRGWFDRDLLLAMKAMNLHSYNEETGVIIGKGVPE